MGAAAAGAALLFGLGGTVLGGALGAAGAASEGDAQKQALKYNIRAARQQQEVNEEAILREAEQVRSSNIVSIAKSGVRREGSPVEVLASNASEIARKVALDRLATESQVDLYQFQKSQVSVATGLSVAGQVLGSAGQTGSTLAMWAK